MASPADCPCARHLVWKLLHNDAGAVGLFARNPFPSRPPCYIRAVRYRYVFAPPTPRARGGRERVNSWLPALSADDPRRAQFLKSAGGLP